MHIGFWQDAGERALRAVVGSGLITALIHALDSHVAGAGLGIDWWHYAAAVAASLLGSYGVSVAAARLTGDGSARIGTTHPVTGDGRGGRPMTHDEIDDVEAQS